MSRGFRQSISGLHTWSGLVIGWLLFAMVATGTLAVFRPEIGNWMRPEVRASADPAAAVAAATDWMSVHHGTSRNWYMVAPSGRTTTTEVAFDDAGAPDGFGRLTLHPLTGRPDGIRQTLGGDFFYRFHFELQLPYPWGRMLAAAAAMMMLIAILSGIIIHKRIFKDFFTLRGGKGKRSWLDGHNVAAVLALPFHLMITATGVVTLLSLVMPWPMTAVYHGDLGKGFADASPGYVERTASGRHIALAPIGPMLAEAQARFDGGHIGRVDVANPGDANAVVTVSRNDSDQLAYAADMIAFDGTTGAVLKQYHEARPAQQTYRVLYGLHMGRFGLALTHWLYFLCGLALCGTIATGLLLWVSGRKAQAGRGFRLVEALNVGAIAGVPIAAIVYLWANRLLPLHMASRDVWEVRFFFAAWGSVLLFGFLRKPSPAWRESMSLAALGAGLLPFVSFATTGRGLWRGFVERDWLFVGTDLTLFAFAALFAFVASHAGRPAAAPRRPRLAAAE